MAEPVRIGPFKGMNNTQGPDGDPNSPHVILNADNDAAGALLARQGKSLVQSLPNAHSLWACNEIMLVAAKDKLYGFDPETGLSSEITGLGAEGRVYYAAVRTGMENSVYVAASGMLGRFDLEAMTMNAWGLPTPPRPTGNIIAGDLEPGLYNVCYTARARGKMSAHSAIKSFSVEDGEGIFLTNVGGFEAWVSDPNGGELQFFGQKNLIREQPAGGEPLPFLNAVAPTPGISHIRWFLSRMWAFSGERLIYSVPFDPELFHPESYFEIEGAGLMIAPVANGLYVSDHKGTVFYAGRDPKAMQAIKVGDRVIPGTLAYVKRIGELGANIPVWLTENGIIAGSHDGQTINLTQRRAKLTLPGNKAAAVAREHNGDIQYLTSYKRKPSGTAASFGDHATAEVIRKGKVIQ